MVSWFLCLWLYFHFFCFVVVSCVCISCLVPLGFLSVIVFIVRTCSSVSPPVPTCVLLLRHFFSSFSVFHCAVWDHLLSVVLFPSNVLGSGPAHSPSVLYLGVSFLISLFAATLGFCMLSLFSKNKTCVCSTQPMAFCVCIWVLYRTITSQVAAADDPDRWRWWLMKLLNLRWLGCNRKVEGVKSGSMR